MKLKAPDLHPKGNGPLQCLEEIRLGDEGVMVFHFASGHTAMILNAAKWPGMLTGRVLKVSDHNEYNSCDRYMIFRKISFKLNLGGLIFGQCFGEGDTQASKLPMGRVL